MPATAPLHGGSDRCGEHGVQAQQPFVRALCRVALGSLALIALCLVSATYARAQDVQRFHPALDDQGFLGLDGTRPPGSLRFALHMMSDLAWHPVELATPRGEIAPISLRWMWHLGAEIGLGGRAAIAARIPLIAFQDGPFRDSSQVFMLADPQLWARYRLLGASMSDRNEPKDGPGLMLQAGALLPLGRREAVGRADEPLPVPVAGRAFASDGRVHGEVSLLGDFQILGAGIGGSVGYRRHFWDPKSVEASATGVRDELTFAAALKLPVPVLPNVAGVVEVRGVSGFQAARDTAVEIDAGLRMRYGSVLLVLGGGGGVTRGVGAPDGRFFFGLYWVPPEVDKDQDGVDDDVDQCPFLAEDRDGFQDSDGCPDPDNDNDLVPDLDDRCPNEPAEEGRDDNEDGCTDAN